jgi:hypothetical protein
MNFMSSLTKSPARTKPLRCLRLPRQELLSVLSNAKNQSGFCGTRFAQTVLEAAYGILKSAKKLYGLCRLHTVQGFRPDGYFAAFTFLYLQPYRFGKLIQRGIEVRIPEAVLHFHVLRAKCFDIAGHILIA